MDTKDSSRRSSGKEHSTADSKRESFHNREDSFKSLHESLDGKDGKDDLNPRGSVAGSGSPRIPRKFISNWRQACDRTRDRTKELLKRWRTLPESETNDPDADAQGEDQTEKDHGWSVHVWATWVRRDPSEDDCPENAVESKSCLSQLQKEKFGHFFTHLLDWDRDDVISVQDFEALSERLRHFADWSTNSAEFHILREVQQGFVDTFINNQQACQVSLSDSMLDSPGTTSLEQWLMQWSHLLSTARNLQDFPLWLQYFSKIIFLVMNKSGSGVISRDELRVFYSSFLGYDTQTVGETLDLGYNNMTSNGDHPLRYHTFHFCFANFLLGRHPHGPGQFLFGPCESGAQYSVMFPVDYSALNSSPEKLEPYSPHKKSNRHSVVV